MERLTEYDYEQVVLKGLNIVGIGESNADILEAGVRKLATYEDIGIPAEDIIDILAIMSESQDDVDDSGISVGMIHDLVELARYRESGLTPEEVKYLRDASSNVLKFVMDKMKIKNECEQWRKEALTYATQLGEIRIWLNQFGCTPEKLIADCKAKSPDTTYAP